ncbi:MAG: phosphate ABC transporter substrate-binding protein PstS [Deltaproteobacteria bacterium]|nr:phosphate ABC transporter substrate-binding protein PstS [Deltaproteobacteria bacterium]
MKKWISLLLTFSSLLGFACSKPSNDSKSSSTSSSSVVKINGAGATFPYPLYSKWFSEYNKINPNIQMNYQSIGSGGGIQQIKAKTVDFGASDAPLSAEEEKSMPAPVVQIPATAGSVVISYNIAGIDKGLKLTGEVVGDIFVGAIKKWNDPKITELNTGINLPDLPIAVIHRSDGSGTTYIFTDYLSKVSPPFASQAGRGKSVNWPTGLGAKGNEGVAGQIKQTPGAIGYIEYAYAVQNKLAFAALKNKSGKFIEPSPAATTAAIQGMSQELQKNIGTSITDSAGENTYPISGLTYLILYKTQEDSTKGKTMLEFLNWAMTEGQKKAEALYYAPLPAEVLKMNEATLSSILVN